MEAYHKVATVRTVDTAWKLVAALEERCAFNSFVVVLPKPSGSCEVRSVGAWHPLDEGIAKEVVQQFLRDHSHT